MTKIFDIVLLLFVLGSALFGVYYSIKLRITSNQLAMKSKQEEDQDILRIFAEMEQKVQEINPDYQIANEEYKKNQAALVEYQEYVSTNMSPTTVATSNHVAI